MGNIYESARVANSTDPSILLSVDDVKNLLEESRDPEELAYYWKALKAATGKKSRKHFVTVIELTNEEAR